MAATAYSAEAGRIAAEHLLDQAPDVTALVTANDMLCLGVYDAMAARGLRVGPDISVTGFNDMPFVDRIAPPLTTVRIQHAAMGGEAAEALLAEITEPTAARREIRLEPELVVRASTAPPAR